MQEALQWVGHGAENSDVSIEDSQAVLKSRIRLAGHFLGRVYDAEATSYKPLDVNSEAKRLGVVASDEASRAAQVHEAFFRGVLKGLSATPVSDVAAFTSAAGLQVLADSIRSAADEDELSSIEGSYDQSRKACCECRSKLKEAHVELRKLVEKKRKQAEKDRAHESKRQEQKAKQEELEKRRLARTPTPGVDVVFDLQVAGDIPVFESVAAAVTQKPHGNPFVLSAGCTKIFEDSGSALAVATVRFGQKFEARCTIEGRAGAPLVEATGSSTAAEYFKSFMGGTYIADVPQSPEADRALRQVWNFGLKSSYKSVGCDINYTGSVRVIAEGGVRVLACRTSALRNWVADLKGVSASGIKMAEARAYFRGLTDAQAKSMAARGEGVVCAVVSKGATLCIPPGWMLAYKAINDSRVFGLRFLWLADSPRIREDLASTHQLLLQGGTEFEKAEAALLKAWCDAAGIVL